VFGLLGFVSLALAFVFGFETPNPVLLMIGGLVFVAPLMVLGHAATTRALTSQEKRYWLRELTGAAVLSAMSEYMASSDLRESARRRAEDAAAKQRTTPSGSQID
jgi:hypothetical protein